MKPFFMNRDYQNKFMYQFREMVENNDNLTLNQIKEHVADITGRSESGISAQIYCNNKLTTDVDIELRKIFKNKSL